MPVPMQALFIGQAYIDVTFLTDQLPPQVGELNGG
jgi:hypothetical protein